MKLPSHTELYYGGRWHSAQGGSMAEITAPATGERLCSVSWASTQDAEAAIEAAKEAFPAWRRTSAAERARLIRTIAQIVREHAEELALLDATDGGSPLTEMRGDVAFAAAQLDFFAGLVTEMKGTSVPLNAESVNFSVREPLGVVARIVPFNHPFAFSAGKAAAPLVAGNTVIIKPSEQAPLSALRFAELIDGVLPPGVINVVNGDRSVGALFASHKDVAMVGVTGSVGTGKAVMRTAADTLKPLLLELGGKNALIAFPDADPDAVAAAAVDGMNFTWCGQSCGSTSRAFIHSDIYDAVLDKMAQRIAFFRPGLPTDPKTTMGSIISKAQFDRIMAYVAQGQAEGARLVYGGDRPDAPELAGGFFLNPTVFADVTQDMSIAREEIFGPVLSVLRWSDRDAMMRDVNSVDYGLTCSIWTNDISLAHRTASEVEAGFIWVNEVGKHILGTPYGGYKQSGIGREESIHELLAFTQEKHIHIRLTAR